MINAGSILVQNRFLELLLLYNSRSHFVIIPPFPLTLEYNKLYFPRVTSHKSFLPFIVLYFVFLPSLLDFVFPTYCRFLFYLSLFHYNFLPLIPSYSFSLSVISPLGFYQQTRFFTNRLPMC